MKNGVDPGYRIEPSIFVSPAIGEGVDRTNPGSVSRRSFLRAVGGAAALGLGSSLLAGCGGIAVPSATGTPTVEVRLNPSQVATAVAQGEGLFKNLDVKFTKVGYGESSALFLANKDPIGFESPWEVARFRSEGENISFFGTAGGLNFWNGVIVRKGDADKYKSIKDLVGKKLGQPGFGTGTWQAFEIIAKSVDGLDAKKQFQLVEADPGALLGLLAKGDIDAALNFAAQAANAMTEDQFKLIYSFTQTWGKAHGQPLLINGMIGRRDFLEKNTDVVRRFIEGTDKGVQWMKDHPEALKPGGKYADWTAGEGWHSNSATADLILKLLHDGTWYYTQDLYTNAWIDSTYEFIQQGKGVLSPEIPPKEEVFFMPDRLKAG